MPYSNLLKGRVSLAGQIYLVTTATENRARIFTDLYLGRALVGSLHSPAVARRATTLAFVLMPDHLHWLLQLQPGQNLSSVVRLAKGASARAVNLARGCQGVVWQPGFHDHALRREENLEAVARYIVLNPVRAGLVRRIGDYSLWDAIWV